MRRSCGHDVGPYAFIAAGAVVTSNVPAYALMVGVPARQAGWMCQCGVRLPFGLDDREESAACATCGSTYRRRGGDVSPEASAR